MTRYGDDSRHTGPWWMTWSRRGDDLTAEEREELEARTDPLIDLVGYRDVVHAAPSTYKRQEDSVARLDPSTVEALREGILENWHARRLRVILAVEPLRQELLPYGGPVSGMLEELERHHLAADLDLSIAAGEGRELWDADVESCVALPAELPRGKYVMLRITGDSMVPLLHSGDRVLVKLGTDPVEESVVVARGEEDGFVAKEVGRISNSMIELRSLNPAYAPLQLWREPGGVLGTVLMRWCSHGAR